MQELTQKQQEVLDFIRDSIERNGYPPAIREICVGVKLKSTSSVHKYIEDLVKFGYLRKSATKKRALELIREETAEEKKTYDVPVFGNVAAGLPIFADDNILDTFPLPMDFARKGELFILKVQGEVDRQFLGNLGTVNLFADIHSAEWILVSPVFQKCVLHVYQRVRRGQLFQSRRMPFHQNSI